MFVQSDGMRCNVAPYTASQAIMKMYDDAMARGRWGLLWGMLTGRSRALHSLDEIIQTSRVQSVSNGGTRMVAIAQIKGSECRAADFDRDFNPLQDRTRERWINIAKAWLRGRYLPPVILIQVGERYFVRDGHHRISVARALGLDEVEAKIEIWTVDKSVSKSPQRNQIPCGQPLIGIAIV